MDRIVMSIRRTAAGDHVLELTRGAAGMPPVPMPPLALNLAAPWVTDFENPGFNRPQLVEEAGDDLDKCLRDHAHYKAAIAGAMTLGSESTRPIFIHLNDEAVEKIPWEALRADTPPRFLTFDSRWPVGRMAGMTGLNDVIRRPLEAELRVLVVLAAKGVSGLPQLDELRKAFDAVFAQVPWRMTVLTKDDAVLKEATLWAAGKPVIVERLLEDKQHLFGVLERDKPHLAHFFCHGTAGGGTSQAGPTLLFATALDEAIDLPESVTVMAEELLNQPAIRNDLWLIVLNCCESAQPRGVPSLARALVHGAVPAVVGMREKVLPDDAHLFCQPFYRAVLRLIAAARAGATSDIEWVTALVDTRWALFEKYSKRPANSSSESEVETKKEPADIREWTVPVIYVRPETFQLRPLPAPVVAPAPAPNLSMDELLELLTVLKDYRASLGPAAPPADLARIDDRIRTVGKLLSA